MNRAEARTAAKHALESLTVRLGATALARRRHRAHTLILAYHNIVPTGTTVHGDQSLHLPQRAFGQQLDVLARVGDVIPLSRVQEPSRNGRPRFVITFDDAYAGALTAGGAELHRRKMPATVFVAPGLLGGTTWWDELGQQSGGEMSARERGEALTRLAGRRNEVLGWSRTRRAGTSIGAGLPAIATEAVLREFLESRLLTVASHSWSHVNLAAVGGEELEREVQRPVQWLQQRFPRQYLPWLSYPYGLFDTSVQRAAVAAGYVAAARVDGGWISGWDDGDPFAVPRHNVPSGISIDGFLLRVSGIGS